MGVDVEIRLDRYGTFRYRQSDGAILRAADGMRRRYDVYQEIPLDLPLRRFQLQRLRYRGTGMPDAHV